MENIPTAVATRSMVKECILIAIEYKGMDIKTFSEQELKNIVDETVKVIEKKGCMVVGE